MNKNGFYRPVSCRKEEEYYIEDDENSKDVEYKPVEFVSICELSTSSRGIGYTGRWSCQGDLPQAALCPEKSYSMTDSGYSSNQ